MDSLHHPLVLQWCPRRGWHHLLVVFYCILYGRVNTIDVFWEVLFIFFLWDDKGVIHILAP